MILSSDGREFQIAGTVLADGTTTIPFSAISLGDKPLSFPLPTDGIVPPIMYVTLNIVGEPSMLVALSMADYTKLALAEMQRSQPTQPLRTTSSFMGRVAQGIARRCGSCGS